MNVHLITNPTQIRYRDSFDQQVKLFDAAIEAKRKGKPVEQYLIFNEHAPVITMGLNGNEENILLSEEQLRADGVDLFHTNRGGDATYHGPGQWTVYPIFDLEQLGLGVRRYIETLEEVAIRVLADYGLVGVRMEDAPGVWMHTDGYPRKVCAIGVKASRFVTMHGIAFNVNTAPEAFRRINPCGFTDRGVTSLARELGHEVPMKEAREALLRAFSDLFGISYRE